MRVQRGNAAGWRALVDTYSAYTFGAKVQCLQSLTSRRVKPGSKPFPVFAAMIEDVRNVRANGSDIEDEVVCLLFLRALLDEYNVFRQMLERKREKLTNDRLRTKLRTRYDLLKEGKSSKTADTVFLLLERSGEIADAAGKNPHNFFLGASERRARRRILVQQDKHSPSTTVPGTQK